MEEQIRIAVAQALEAAGANDVSFTVERPGETAFGDYATNAAMVAAKQLGKNPRELADSLAQTLIAALGDKVVSHVAVAGPGFINITLTREAVSAIVADAATKNDWGKGVLKAGKKVIVEYSDPNAFKEMHIGHLVGTVLGEAVARLLENAGATVARETFGGDIGPNVAKAIWGLRQAGILEPTTAGEIGAAYTVGAVAYETNPDARVEIDALNQAIYAGTDEELKKLWAKGREVSVAEFRRLWSQLGTHFDHEFFDSDTIEMGVQAVKDGLEKGIFDKSDGAIIFNGEKKCVHTMVFLTSHDTPTYEAKDMGLALIREKRWPADEVIIVSGNEQIGRFKTVLAALGEIAPELAAKSSHLPNGFLKLASGKMSSREGNVITAADFITEVIEKASEKNADAKIAEEVAIGALKFMILRQAPGSDIMFDEEKSLSLEGDSGPYLQYALVRAKSVIAQASGAAANGAPTAPYQIERTLIHYPTVAARAAYEKAPNLLVTYLLALAGEWNAFYAQERIIGGDFEAYKLQVAKAFVQTMTSGLTLLGIPTPEKM